MNWIQRLYELKGKDLYSQNSEGYYLEYIFHRLHGYHDNYAFLDIGGGDGFYLSNTRHLGNLGWSGLVLDRENGIEVTIDNILELIDGKPFDLLSIDIDGNDLWVIDKILKGGYTPSVIIAEFNAMYTDSRAIRYNKDHVWAGGSYYGFTFKAGEKLAELHGYKVIFQIADMNMIMVRADLIEGLEIPEVTFKQNDFFKLSDREDWIKI